MLVSFRRVACVAVARIASVASGAVVVGVAYTVAGAASAASMAPATSLIWGMSYQKCGFTSGPVARRTSWTETTMRPGCLVAPSNWERKSSYPAPFPMTNPASATATALATSDSYRWGSAVGLVRIEVTRTWRPPICAAMFPQKFSPATTRTTPGLAGGRDPTHPARAVAATARTARRARTRGTRNPS